MLFRSYALALGALTLSTLLSACSTGELPPAPATAAVEQHADGCGAFRFRGDTNVTCDYEARLVDNADSATTQGTCLNDSQISCSYRFSCEWAAPVISSACRDGSDATACETYPPEASVLDPLPYVVNLEPGSTLCDPPGSEAARRNYCWNTYQSAWPQARDQCRTQTSRNSGRTNCCLACPTPQPLPETCEGDECSCVGEGDGSGSGSDAPPPPPPPPGEGDGSGSGF